MRLFPAQATSQSIRNPRLQAIWKDLIFDVALNVELVATGIIIHSTTTKPLIETSSQISPNSLYLHTIVASQPNVVAGVNVAPIYATLHFISSSPTLSQEDLMAVTSSSIGNTYKLTAANDAITGGLQILSIRWVGATTAAHTLELRTGAYGANDIVHASIANGANFVDTANFNPPLKLTNLKVQTLGSGTVYVRVA